MKRILAFATLVLAAATASAQFEGQADFKITTNAGKDQTMNGTGKMFVTRSAYRSEFEMKMTDTEGRKSGAPARMKMTMFAKASEPDKLYMLNDENKTYSIWDTAKFRDDAKKRPKETYTVKKLGKDTVAGLSCQNALLTSSKGDEIEACVSSELGASTEWLSAMNRRDGGSGSWIEALRGAGLEGFPVRWSTRGRGSKDATTTMELTRVERRTVPVSLFQVPSGYKQTDAAMGGLTPEQEKAMSDAKAQMNEALKDMTPEQRRQYEEMMKSLGQPTPKP
jgi:FlaG/FlaF family flagellin (archaellin)